jgi:hypothetical protein
LQGHPTTQGGREDVELVRRIPADVTDDDMFQVSALGFEDVQYPSVSHPRRPTDAT